MRIATTLMLGAALIVGASAAGWAQDSGFKAVPAVPAVASGQAASAKPAAATPSTKEAAVTPKPAADAPPSADAADTHAVDVNGDPLQEAKNDDPSTIDATADKTDSDSIIATVNDESISDYELRQRVALYLALNGINQQLIYMVLLQVI